MPLVAGAAETRVEEALGAEAGMADAVAEAEGLAPAVDEGLALLVEEGSAEAAEEAGADC